MTEPEDAGAAHHRRCVADLGELLDQVATGILWFDGSGRTTWVNQGAHALLRLPAFVDPEAELDRWVAIRDERGRTIAELAQTGPQGALRGTWIAATVALADGTTLPGRIRVGRRLHALAGHDAIVVTVWGPDTAPREDAPQPADHPQHVRRVLAAMGITEREADVAILLLQGFRVGTISERLHHSPHTIRNRLKRLFQKTGTASQPELIAALRRHLDAAERTVDVPGG